MPTRARRRISAEDLYRFRLISDCRISPDGSCVVFVLNRVDRKTEKKHANLWIVPTGRGAPRQFTHGEQSDTSPRWSPDGRQIAFLSNRDDEKQPQLCLIPIDGGEARKLTDLKGEFGSFEWSPDGRKLVASFRKKDREDIEREQDEERKKRGVVARHISRVFFKEDGVGFLPKERWHIWTVDARTGKAKQLTDGEVHDEQEPTFSPDGKQILFASNRTPDPDLSPEDIDLWTIPSEGGDLRKVETPLGVKLLPSFSPDGKLVAYVGTEGRGGEGRNARLWVVPTEGSVPARDLTGQYDVCVTAWTLNDMARPMMMPPTWSPDGKRLYFQVARHGNTTLHSIAPDGSGFETVIGDTGVVGAFAFDRDHTVLAYVQGTMTDPGQVWLRSLETGKSRKLTDANGNLLRALDLGTVEEVWFKDGDGGDLQGWVLKPPGFDERTKYPTIIEVHGGPHLQYGNLFMHEFYFLAAHDYVVCFSNPRGGQGYGEKHALAIENNWGTVDYEDVMTWADLVGRKPYVDAERMGVTGGSYGGYMTNWIIGHTDRFRAAVTQRCVSNLISMYGSSDGSWSFQREFGDVPPWEDVENYWRQSPMKYIGNAKTPTLVIHSENDYRCAVEQGEQVFVALKKLGVDTEMVRFPDESHGLSRGGRTDRRIERLNHILRWFEKYLKRDRATSRT